MDTIELFKQAMLLVVLLTAPALVTAVVSGVLISLIQALMQVQDQTLPYAVKLVAVTMTLLLSGRWMGVELLNLTSLAFDAIAVRRY
ncbi:Type III secretion inner membrane protein (YscS) [Pseudomonas synxantha]|uniref:Type III secretion inner membrane protein (YscS) n=1 Tax=Pseudomonas synxantha TaxID=47883 RepID=A0A3G7UBY6_9PSED|nr:type III secretion system export apparatus subunit SctS [Pseudomonas synxantha]AZE56877.1 Type III secretion inner membrane protein (YscS) [Pseudomonas synxantha]